MTTYTRRAGGMVCSVRSSGASIKSPFWVVRDAPEWETFAEQHIPEFLRESSAVLKSSIDSFVDMSNESTEESARKLQMMLETLIHAKSQH